VPVLSYVMINSSLMTIRHALRNFQYQEKGVALA
jgi:hypothetical protein